jgi:hypothetical protein
MGNDGRHPLRDLLLLLLHVLLLLLFCLLLLLLVCLVVPTAIFPCRAPHPQLCPSIPLAWTMTTICASSVRLHIDCNSGTQRGTIFVSMAFHLILSLPLPPHSNNHNPCTHSPPTCQQTVNYRQMSLGSKDGKETPQRCFQEQSAPLPQSPHNIGPDPIHCS